MSTPRLWSWHLSPFAAKVRVAFAEKSAAFTLVEVSGNPSKRPARLRELNPAGRVPVLEVDGRAIRESAVICGWLEETRPEPPLWPTDPTQRAAARGLGRWVDDELTGTFFLSLRKEAFGADPDDPPDVVERMRARLAAAWPVAEQILNRTDAAWLMGGERPTLADLGAIPLAVRVAEWRPDLGPDPRRAPRAEAWLASLRERPSAAEVGRRGEPYAG